MEDKKKHFINWIKIHKKQLILAGISIPTLIAFVLGMKNKDDLLKIWDNLKNEIEKSNLYSSKWFEGASDAELGIEREKVRLAYCSSGDDFNKASALQNFCGDLIRK